MDQEKSRVGNTNFGLWYIVNLSKVILIFTAFILFLKRSWVGEDAFIFFKYIDNLVHGNGLVFNIGERVEGFTAPLWVFLLSLLRALTGYNLRPMAIILGLLLSALAVGLFLFYFTNANFFFPIGFVLLVGNSAFRDFATSGFETSLTYLLLILILILLYKDIYLKKSIIIGILASLLTLNRPEAFLILLYIATLITYSCYRSKNWSNLLKFSIPVVLLLGGYQIFRMGYFASLLPNTFYAKKGGTLYLSQGFNYIKDFVISYWFTALVSTAALVCALVDKALFAKIKHFLVLHVVLTGYVLYAGGDYMHGRSLLMSFICLMALVQVTGQFLAKKYATKLQQASSTYQLILIVLAFAVLKASTLQIPITTKLGRQVNNIANERSRFGYDFDIKYFKRYMSLPITGELGWAERGYYYRELSEKLQMPFSVVNTNIGYFGYAAGDLVNIMGGSLIDPYIARQPVTKRGKIGHENDPALNYVLSRKPTFAYTPFKYWNEHAHFKWERAKFAYIIKDDSNESFIPIFDLSNKEFLAKLSTLIGKDIKGEIDKAQREYLVSLPVYDAENNEVNDYIDFLNTYWYPYASPEDKKLFENAINTRQITGKYSFTKQVSIWPKVTSNLDLAQFIQNMKATLKSND